MVTVERINELEYDIVQRIQTSKHSSIKHNSKIIIGSMFFEYAGDDCSKLWFRSYKDRFLIDYDDILSISKDKVVVFDKILFYMLNAVFCIMSLLAIGVAINGGILYLFYLFLFAILYVLCLMVLRFPVLTITLVGGETISIPFNIKRDKSDYLQYIYDLLTYIMENRMS